MILKLVPYINLIVAGRFARILFNFLLRAVYLMPNACSNVWTMTTTKTIEVKTLTVRDLIGSCTVNLLAIFRRLRHKKGSQFSRFNLKVCQVVAGDSESSISLMPFITIILTFTRPDSEERLRISASLSKSTADQSMPGVLLHIPNIQILSNASSSAIFSGRWFAEGPFHTCDNTRLLGTFTSDTPASKAERSGKHDVT